MTIKGPDGVLIDVELKNIIEGGASGNNLDNTLKEMMREKTVKGSEDAANELQAGQLLSDLAKFNLGKGKQLWFSGEITGTTSEQITRRIIELLKKNENTYAKRYFNIDILDQDDVIRAANIDEWHDLLEELERTMLNTNFVQIKSIDPP